MRARTLQRESASAYLTPSVRQLRSGRAARATVCARVRALSIMRARVRACMCVRACACVSACIHVRACVRATRHASSMRVGRSATGGARRLPQPYHTHAGARGGARGAGGAAHTGTVIRLCVCWLVASRMPRVRRLLHAAEHRGFGGSGTAHARTNAWRGGWQSRVPIPALMACLRMHAEPWRRSSARALPIRACRLKARCCSVGKRPVHSAAAAASL